MKEQVSTLEKGANILLSLMQLNIGGAETHVVELAKELHVTNTAQKQVQRNSTS